MAPSKQPVRLMRGGLSGRVYAVTRYRDLGNGQFEAIEKHDVTDDLKHIGGCDGSPPAAPGTTDPADRLRAISLMWAQATNRGRPFLADTGNVPALRDLLDGYDHPDELPDPADVDIEHIRLANGPCVISVNGQGHLPCAEHPTAPVPDLMEALRLSIVEAKERREAKATDPGAVVCSACRRAHPEARECPPAETIHARTAERERQLTAEGRLCDHREHDYRGCRGAQEAAGGGTTGTEGQHYFLPTAAYDQCGHNPGRIGKGCGLGVRHPIHVLPAGGQTGAQG